MKKCPFCAEITQDDAIKCKHCGEWINSESERTKNSVLEIERLDAKWWYRLLKVLFLLSFCVVTVGWISYGYIETDGNMEKFLMPAIISLLVITLLFWLIQKLFHYVAWGKATQSIPRSVNEWSTNRTINKVVLILFPFISLFAGIFSLIDTSEHHFLVSFVYFLFAYIGLDSLLKRRVENNTWFLRGRWVMGLAWVVFIIFVISIAFSLYFFLIRPLLP